MEFIQDHTSLDIIRRIDVIDGPVLQQQTSFTGKRMRVEMITVRFASRNGRDWEVQGADLHGPVLKMDGTDSLNTASNHVMRYDLDSSRYAWLRKLLDAIRPEGEIVLPFRLSGLENPEEQA